MYVYIYYMYHTYDMIITFPGYSPRCLLQLRRVPLPWRSVLTRLGGGGVLKTCFIERPDTTLFIIHFNDYVHFIEILIVNCEEKYTSDTDKNSLLYCSESISDSSVN